MIMSLIAFFALNASADIKLPNVFKDFPKKIGLYIAQENGIGEPLFTESELKEIYKDFEKRLVIAGFVPQAFQEHPRLLVEFTNFRKGNISSMTYRLAFQEACNVQRNKDIAVKCTTYEIRNGHIADSKVVKQIFKQEISSQLDVFLLDRAEGL